MINEHTPEDDELTGAIAPPMANGEVVFESPWQGRVFGMARHLSESGRYTWDEFRGALIQAIEAAPEREYFESFLVALENLLAQKQMVDPPGLDHLTATLAARPHGHDHAH